jgi:SAM-dependent methyltransferase
VTEKPMSKQDRELRGAVRAGKASYGEPISEPDRPSAAMVDSTLRFSSRVDNYVKYRPVYPAGIIDALAEACGLTPSAVIADVGAGTGILSEMLLRNGNAVIAVEPNREMRESAARLQSRYPSMRVVDGAAEATTLADRSVDFVVVGQAFHWFDPQRTRREFARVLRPGGWVVLVWNQRDTQQTAFLREYEAMVAAYSVDYERFKDGTVRVDVLSEFFHPDGFAARTYYNEQNLAYEALRGLLLSVSVTPEEEHPAHEPMMERLRQLFATYQNGGVVSITYTTRLFYGRL